MNKAELIEAMVSRTGHSKKATAESLNAFISVVSICPFSIKDVAMLRNNALR